MKKWIIKQGTEYLCRSALNANRLVFTSPLNVLSFPDEAAVNKFRNDFSAKEGFADLSIEEVDECSLVRLITEYHLKSFLTLCGETIGNKTVKDYLERYLSDLTNHAGGAGSSFSFNSSVEIDGKPHTAKFKESTIRWLADHGIYSLDSLLGFTGSVLDTFSTPSRYKRDVYPALRKAGLSLQEKGQPVDLELDIENLGLRSNNLAKLKRHRIYTTTQLLTMGYGKVLKGLHNKVDTELLRDLNECLSRAGLARHVSWCGIDLVEEVDPNELSLKERDITPRIMYVLKTAGYLNVYKLHTLTKNQVSIMFSNYAAIMGDSTSLADHDVTTVIRALARRGLVLHKSRMTAFAARRARYISL
jgi:hypothetical protein